MWDLGARGGGFMSNSCHLGLDPGGSMSNSCDLGLDPGGSMSNSCHLGLDPRLPYLNRWCTYLALQEVIIGNHADASTCKASQAYNVDECFSEVSYPDECDDQSVRMFIYTATWIPGLGQKVTHAGVHGRGSIMELFYLTSSIKPTKTPYMHGIDRLLLYRFGYGFE